MIEINLLPGKKKKAAGAGGAGFKLSLPDFKALLAQVKDPWLIAAIAAWVIVGGGGAAMFLANQARLKVAETRRDAVRAEKRRYDIVIAQKRALERVRDSLAFQITMIKQIDGDRYVWPHILDQVTKALPPYTWITRVQSVSSIVGPTQPGGPPPVILTDSTGRPTVTVAITGRTVDIQAYTTFLRQLAASPWLTDVTPASSQTVIEADRPVTAFDVSVRYRIADSVYIRTVPFVQAVR